jgi:N-acetylmuramoyl-L-alanine amidase
LNYIIFSYIYLVNIFMHIHNHRLAPDPGDPSINYILTPNKGGTLKPRYLIMHYTAGASAKSSIEWLTNRQAKASAHLVIAADGSITQLLPFNVVAWHAGISSWKELNGLNQHSIGIELDNPGRLTRVGKRWLSWVGNNYNRIPARPSRWSISGPGSLAVKKESPRASG